MELIQFFKIEASNIYIYIQCILVQILEYDSI